MSVLEVRAINLTSDDTQDSKEVSCLVQLNQYQATIDVPSIPVRIPLGDLTFDTLFITLLCNQKKLDTKALPLEEVFQGNEESTTQLYFDEYSLELALKLISQESKSCLRCSYLETIINNLNQEVSEPKDSYKEETYKATIESLEAKLQSQESLVEENSRLKQQLAESAYKRQELQASTSQTIKELNQQLNKQENYLTEILNERDSAWEAMRSKIHEVSQLEDKAEDWKIKYQEASTKLEELNTLLFENTESSVNRAELHSKLESAYQEKQSIETKFEECIKGMEESLQVSQERVRVLSKEKIKLTEECEALNNQTQQDKGKIASLESKIALLSSKNLNIEKLQTEVQSLTQENHNLKQRLTKASNDFQQKALELNKTNKELLTEKVQNNEQLSKLLQALNSKMSEISYLKQHISKQETEIVNLKDSLRKKETLNATIDQLQNTNQKLDAEKERLLSELGNLSDLLTNQGNRNQHLNKTVLKLKSEATEKDQEIEELKTLVYELQKDKKEYTPVKDDPIDEALANYINKRPKPLKVPFTRQKKGSYMFGTKKVYVKLEQGKIIIRVGGGFMHLDEFLEVYTPLELEKLENKKLNQSASKIEFSSKLTETESRPATMTPSRAAKILKDNLSEGKFMTFHAVSRTVTSPPKSPIPVRTRPRNKSSVDLSNINRE